LTLLTQAPQPFSSVSKGKLTQTTPAAMGLMLSAILLAPILIGCEVFGFGNLPAFFIVCAVAYLFNMDKSIYALQERT
jgi:hypothetical protein